jgi:hypothetical protein
MESEPTLAVHDLSDEELLRRLRELVAQSRRVEADLVSHIAEVDARRLYARQAYSSMFAYCTGVLHLSEAEAYRRITVARAGRKYPALLERLRSGQLHLSGIAMLAPLLTADNCERVLQRATHRSKRQLEELVAELSPRPDVPPLIRAIRQARPNASTTMLPGVCPEASELVPGRVEAKPVSCPSPVLPIHPRPAFVVPLSPGRFKIQFTAGAELRDKIERLTALMRSEVPDGDLAAVIDIAVTERLERLEARRFGRTRAPRKTLADTKTRPHSRHIPAAVRRAVRQRDGDSCHFVDEQGRRCAERHRLEFHHRQPFALGGDHSPANVTLLCPTHNRSLAERDLGRTATRHPLNHGAQDDASDAVGHKPWTGS